MITGIHHVTAIAGEPQRNLDFWSEVLGLRLVKRTVNFDDPETYHLYYGNEVGEPGTIMTFFPWPGRKRGGDGAGQVATTSLSAPPESIGFWMDRLNGRDVAVEGPAPRFDEEVIGFRDPHGLKLEIVAAARADDRVPWQGGTVPAEHAIRGISAVTLSVADPGASAELLSATMGFRDLAEEGGRRRLEVGDGAPGALVDLVSAPTAERGTISVGSVHHVAWRTPGDEEQERWRKAIAEQGIGVTRVLDRNYFRSIYFREPGGVLFEIATDPPGFTADEQPAELGSNLKLPAWLESRRNEIEAVLPELATPGPRSANA